MAVAPGDDPRLDRPNVLIGGDRGPDDAVVVDQGLPQRDAFQDGDAGLLAGSTDEDHIEGLATHRQAVADLARILRRIDRPRAVERVGVVLAHERWRAGREHLGQHADTVERRDTPRSSEEVRRDRGARERRAVHDEHAPAGLPQRRGEDRSGDAGADDEHVHLVDPVEARIVVLAHRALDDTPTLGTGMVPPEAGVSTPSHSLGRRPISGQAGVSSTGCTTILRSSPCRQTSAVTLPPMTSPTMSR